MIVDDNNPFSLRSSFVPPSTRVTEHSDSVTPLWFLFHRDKLLMVNGADNNLALATAHPKNLEIETDYHRFFGFYEKRPCYVAEITDGTNLDSHHQFIGIRSLFGDIDDDYFNLAGRALQVLHHHHEHQYCSKCSTPLTDKKSELAKECPSCGFVTFPRVSPAVIMAVTKGDKILLGRASRFPPGMYSTLAGFVEPGETLEEAVQREVFEETGITAGDVRYVSSQPWPFPHSIMVGFTATYKSGEITVDTEELEDASWFSAKNMPRLPSKISIARLLIDDFLLKQS